MVNLTKQTKPVKEKEIIPQWHLIDVSGQILGRVAGKISILLQGKHKVNYVPYLNSGDYVVVINAKRVKVTGKKNKNKIYTHYSGYPGGLKRIPYEKMHEDNPKEIIRRAVSGMLPKNKHRDLRLARLFIFSNEKHTYEDKFKK